MSWGPLDSLMWNDVLLKGYPVYFFLEILSPISDLSRAIFDKTIAFIYVGHIN